MPDLRLVTAPEQYPVTRDQAKKHLRVSSPSQDDLIDGLIGAATKKLDGKSGYLFRCLMPQTWAQSIDLAFPTCNEGRIDLPLGPVLSVTSITYVDSDGEEQTVGTSIYEFCQADGLADSYVRLKWNQSWPVCRRQARAITITYVAGYADDEGQPDPDAVPEPIRVAMLMLIGSLYSNRETVKVGTIVTELPKGFDFLLEDYRRVSV